ncbi:MAG: ExbD/TolR family protein [Humidesulfovibrio sp.]|jgi:biopolymer transport protein TolR|uniref:ExbD/TolR family protein n=1 Tax=Humidesulfovibrio sp. TaxID=2910988 RepID=UPI0027FCF763|nr:ExbD/TolR family protein [Humidesulfovibrio sp.]MDQ7835584.1 ExbD/TolR family protein [Humidesulfovibrio sp.]
MGASVGGRGRYMAEINVTPFVDVMLVLLIIFMVTAPMLTQGVDVDLPKTRSVRTLPAGSYHLVLSIRKDGGIFLDEYNVPFEDLRQHLMNLVVVQKKQLYLRADKEVPYGVVVKVMGEIKSVGIEKLGVVAESGEPNATTPVSRQTAQHTSFYPRGASPK